MDLIGDPKKLADAFEPMLENLLRRTLDGAKVELVDGGLRIVFAPPPSLMETSDNWHVQQPKT
jgi:hypothetical protein